VTIYYLSGTTGWSISFAGRVAVMLNAPPQFGVTADSLEYLSDGVQTVITKYAGDTATNTELTIPTSINGLPVTVIASFAFENSPLIMNATIPNSVTIIGESAFGYCPSLANVSGANGVTYIGNIAFIGCYSLTNVAFPDGLTSIGDYAFEQTACPK
jgi:hypothetical protein